jgi:hypothetical protein
VISGLVTRSRWLERCAPFSTSEKEMVEKMPRQPAINSSFIAFSFWQSFFSANVGGSSRLRESAIVDLSS